MSKRRLSQEKTVQVADWLRKNQKAIEAGRTTCQQAAAMALTALGYPVTDGAILRIGSGVGVRFAPPRRRERRDRAMSVLGRSLLSLFQSLGEAPPQQLVELLGTGDDQDAGVALG